MHRRGAAVLASCLALIPTAPCADTGQQLELTPHQIVRCFNSSLVVVEAENFTTAAPSGCRGAPWSPCVWGADDNLFASDVSNVFHSRVGYLHADADAIPGASVSATVAVPADGQFHVMARYEAGYRFSSPFRVTARQNASVLFDRVFGLRTTPKVWPFWYSRSVASGCGPGLQAECRKYTLAFPTTTRYGGPLIRGASLNPPF